MTAGPPESQGHASSVRPANPIDAPGTGEADWLAWPGLNRLPVTDITGWRSAVILAAHPDDEVLGAGGMIARLAAAGCRPRIIAVTDGEASHPHHQDPAGLARRRVSETRAALAALGAGGAEVIRLGLPDAGLTGLHNQLAERLRDLVAGFDVRLAPWEGDVHGDHEAVGRAIRQLPGLAFCYPVWMWHWGRPADIRVPWAEARRVPLPPAARDRKHAAIRCFASQLEARAPHVPPMLSAGFLAHFSRTYEVLFPVRRS
jgi:LmbE family N-acetylglucosaminyl deacetylase